MLSNTNFDLSLVVACYCDAPHIFANTVRLAEYLSHTDLKCEIIYVEDCSPDDTKAEVRKCLEYLAKSKIDSQMIEHQVNIGRGGAVRDGLDVARGAVAGFIDIDLEHMMDAILPMFLLIQNHGWDVVTGKRLMLEPSKYKMRSVASHVYRMISKLFLNFPVTDSETGLKLFRREGILPILKKTQNEQWFWDTEILHRAYSAGLKIKEHPIVFVKNLNKKSTVFLIRDSIRYLLALIHYRKIISNDFKR